MHPTNRFSLGSDITNRNDHIITQWRGREIYIERALRSGLNGYAIIDDGDFSFSFSEDYAVGGGDDASSSSSNLTALCRHSMDTERERDYRKRERRSCSLSPFFFNCFLNIIIIFN